MQILDTLNAAQRVAVEHPARALLVIAGAGSGKTRVLTARVAWLLERGVAPEAILAFTFTNRAAKEMRERIAALAETHAARLWVGTFHATAVRILRREAGAAGIPSSFAIYDREDQEALIRDLARRLGWSEGSWKMGAVLGQISDAKNALVGPEEFARTSYVEDHRKIAECYRLYEAELRRNGALDFDDLIVRVVRLFLDDPAAAARWRARFAHVLVDEYQDTNHAQFRLVQALTGADGHVFVVGDDDQSIYGWRGADLANVLEFEQAFPGAGVVRLEQNYRSTPNILEAANAVISNNEARKGKELWSDRPRGKPLRFVHAQDDVDEAKRVRQFILERVRRGGRLADVAVLYRTNAQSRALETELRQGLMPYEVVGGVAFYQRREIKDLLAYLRAAVQPADTVAFWRIWNTPRRGLGAAVRALVEQRMASDGVPAAAALRALVEAGALSAAARAGATRLLGILDAIALHPGVTAEHALGIVLERAEYLAMIDAEEGGQERRENVQELVAAAARAAAEGGGGLDDFLAESALVTDVDRVDAEADRVLLCTGHNAKGLEFPAVAIVGLEEGLFPHGNSADDAKRLEEERRLFYVALTRARDEVLLTAAAYRRRFDGTRTASISRFVGEIPGHLLEREAAVSWRPATGESWLQRPRSAPAHRGAFNRSAARPPARRYDEDLALDFDPAPPADDVLEVAAGTPLRTRPAPRAGGRTVFHPQFGMGVVLSAEGAGAELTYEVRFGVRVKKVRASFLKEVGDGS